MRPYYSHDGIEIYHGDCREILPSLPKVDLVLTDPPYGIAWKKGLNRAVNSRAHGGIQGDDDTSVRDAALAMLAGTRAVVFGSFYAPFPANVKQVLVWQKPGDAGVVGATTGFRRDVEPVFLCGHWPIVTVQWSSVFSSRGEFRGRAAAVSDHPHVKPLDLIVNLLRCAGGESVLDPFMGSGTTLVAAKRLGRRAIGIEIEEKYCEIAARRVEAERLTLFEHAGIEQASFGLEAAQ